MRCCCEVSLCGKRWSFDWTKVSIRSMRIVLFEGWDEISWSLSRSDTLLGYGRSF